MPGTYDFSFSGVKTAVFYYVNKQGGHKDFNKAKIAYAFQESVVDVIVEKCLLACRQRRVSTLLVGGGVAANSALRQRMAFEASRQGIDVRFPAMSFCLDNAAMIAGLGFRLRRHK